MMSKDCAVPVQADDALVLNNTYPASPAAAAGTEPDIVCLGEPKFDRKMWPEPIRIHMLFLVPCPQIEEACSCLVVWDSPFCRVLRILPIEINR
jgi:hypothetical protein